MEHSGKLDTGSVTLCVDTLRQRQIRFYLEGVYYFTLFHLRLVTCNVNVTYLNGSVCFSGRVENDASVNNDIYIYSVFFYLAQSPTMLQNAKMIF